MIQRFYDYFFIRFIGVIISYVIFGIIGAVAVGLYFIYKLHANGLPKMNTNYKDIIGKPYKFGNLEIAQYDFPEMMNWNDAKKACELFGDGWRLPTKDELNSLHKSKFVTLYSFYTIKNSDFEGGYYWSSTEYLYSYAWAKSFYYGGSQNDFSKTSRAYVRAVRSF